MLYFIIITSTLLAACAFFWPCRKYFKSLTILISAILGLSLIMLVLYYHWGSSQQIIAYNAEQENALQVKKVLSHFKNNQEIIDAMKKAIAQNPNDAKGWYLLGRLYRAEKNNAEALSCFKKAYALDPQKFNVTFEYLKSLYAAEQQQHTPKIKQLIRQLKQQQPNNPALLDFLGYDAYTHHHYQAAVTYWETLLPYVTSDPDTHKAILLAIGKAQKKLIE